MWTNEIFEISNIYLIKVTYNIWFVRVYIQRKILNKYYYKYLFQVSILRLLSRKIFF